MSANGAQPAARAGHDAGPARRSAPENWAARLVQARQSLRDRLHQSRGAQRLEALLAHVGGHIPAVRERSQPRVVGWLRCRKSSGVSLKLRPSGWRHLCDAIDPERDALVLTWGATAGGEEPHWIINACAKSELPPRALQRSVLLRLRELLVLIPQKEHLLELNGCVLLVTAGRLSIE